ncbi:MAG: hypothetical protein KDA25_04140, partial [Phycisphaerales bacterium]|nr:hypothetical protein [Phycisphaerales bacterium]
MRFGRGSGLGAIVAILLALAGVAHAQEDVRIDLAEFGVGSAVRPGGMTGIRVELTSSVAGAVFNAIVQWEIEDADGDTVLYARTVALSPGQTKPVWLYGTLLPSPNTNANSRWMIRVFRETSDGRRGEEIGRRSIGINATGGTAAQWVDDDMSMIGVIGNADGGRNRVGLRELENPDSSLTRHPAANETPRIIRGLNARELPDRWFGLSPYDVIVWSADQINLSDESEL